MYTVEMGVRGAMRIITNTYLTRAEAIAKAKRWSVSNSTGHYWSEVKDKEGRIVVRYNLG